MAKISKSNATALEICDSHITVAQLHESSHGPTVKLLKSAALPPRTVIDGEITDPQQLSEAILRLFKEAGIKGMPLLVGTNNKAFIKRVDRLPEMPLEDLKAEVEIRVGNAAFLKGEAFQSDYLKISTQGLQVHSNPPLFYVGIQRSKVETLKTLIETDGFQLGSIDLMPLAILRALTWKGSHSESYLLTVTIESNFIDLNIIHNQNILFTNTVRMDVVGAHESSIKELSDTLIQKITLFLIAYSNTFPKESLITKALLFTRLQFGTSIPELLTSHFGKIEFSTYEPRQNIHFDSKFPNPETNAEARDQNLRSVPAIGLALKAFEEHQRSISITKVHRSIGPIIYPRIFKKYAMIGLALIASIYGGSFTLDHFATKYQNNIKLTQGELRSLQSGDYLRRQQALREVKGRIGFLDQIQNSAYSNLSFLEKIVEGMPLSLTLTHLQVDKVHNVTLKGSSYSQESIFSFYNHLQSLYKNITISGITHQNRDGVSTYLFEMKFIRN